MISVHFRKIKLVQTNDEITGRRRIFSNSLPARCMDHSHSSYPIFRVISFNSYRSHSREAHREIKTDILENFQNMLLSELNL